MNQSFLTFAFFYVNFLLYSCLIFSTKIQPAHNNNTANKAFPNLTDAYWARPAGRHIIKIQYVAIYQTDLPPLILTLRNIA